MNREIKFRGFSEELNRFVYGFYQEVEVEGVGYSYIFWQGNTTPVHANSVSQFLGLYDINGKELYDRDIVKWGMQPSSKEVYLRFATVHLNPDIQFKIIYYFDIVNNKKIKGDNYIFNFGSFAYRKTENNLEVIGNIVENPDWS